MASASPMRSSTTSFKSTNVPKFPKLKRVDQLASDVPQLKAILSKHHGIRVTKPKPKGRGARAPEKAAGRDTGALPPISAAIVGGSRGAARGAPGAP